MTLLFIKQIKSIVQLCNILITNIEPTTTNKMSVVITFFAVTLDYYLFEINTI